MTEQEKQNIIEMIKELNLDSDRQVDLIQRLEREGLTDELKRELLKEVEHAETSLMQEEEITAIVNAAYDNPSSISKLMEKSTNEFVGELAKIDAKLEEMVAKTEAE